MRVAVVGGRLRRCLHGFSMANAIAELATLTYLSLLPLLAL